MLSQANPQVVPAYVIQIRPRMKLDQTSLHHSPILPYSDEEENKFIYSVSEEDSVILQSKKKVEPTFGIVDHDTNRPHSEKDINTIQGTQDQGDDTLQGTQDASDLALASQEYTHISLVPIPQDIYVEYL